MLHSTSGSFNFNGLSQKFWSGVKIGPGGPKLAAKIGPPLPKMVCHDVRAEFTSIVEAQQQTTLAKCSKKTASI